jgi:uncharacterized membrane protein (DUF106 family)
MLDLKKKMLMLTFLVLASVVVLYLPFSMVLGQAAGTSIGPVTPESAMAGKPFNVNVHGTINTVNGPFLILLIDKNGNFVQLNGTANGNSLPENLLVPALPPGKYNITLQDVTNGAKATFENYHVAAEGIAAIPIAAFLIMLVAVSISFINMGLNRVIITRMIGWHEYRSMQKEISEYNSQRMAALRSKDEKVLEKLKKKDSQIQSMQTKMFKPQLILIPITFVYLIIWPALTGVFPFSVAYVPGLGPQPFFVWYLICSFFFGTIASRVIGVTPIQ